jgi:hypothetical protein
MNAKNWFKNHPSTICMQIVGLIPGITMSIQYGIVGLVFFMFAAMSIPIYFFEEAFS